MAPLNPPTYLQAGTYPARYDRLALAALMPPVQGTGPLAIRPGVRPSAAGANLLVTQRSTPGMFVTVSAGTAYVQSASATGGVYLVHNDASYDVAIAAAHATLGRKDIVVARVYDAEVTGTVNACAVEVVAGTPSGSPTAPAVPAGSVLLATVQVNAAATQILNASITDGRAYTTALGGTVPAPAASLPANPYAGMAAYDTTNLLPKWYSGAAWRGWQDEGYITASYLSSNNYVTTTSLSAGGYQPHTYVIKPSDTSRSSTTAMANDPHLTISVAANAIYWVELFLIYDASTGGDITIGWSAPSGAAFDWVSDMLSSTATTGVDAVSRTAQGTANNPGGGARGAGNNTVAPARGLLQTGGTPGSLTLQWAQTAVDATATRVRANSLLIARRMV